MKAGWTDVTLGQVCYFENGDRGKNYPGRKAFVSEGVPFINAGHLEDGQVDWDEMNFIPEASFRSLGSGKVRKGDVLYCLRGSLGKFGVVDREGDGAIASSLVIVRPKDAIDPGYLAMYLRSPIADEMVAKHAGGAAQPNLSAKNLAEYRLPLPPLDEQRRIVAVLDEAFGGLARARENAEANVRNARELYRSTLTRLTSAFGQEYRECELQELAQGGSPITYGVVKPGEQGTVPFVRGGDLRDGEIDVGGLRTITDTVSKQFRRTILQGGELLVCLVGQPGQTGIVPALLNGANIARQTALVRVGDAASAEFLSFFLLSDEGQRRLGAYTQGAVQQVINLEDLRKVRVPVPARPIQDAIALQCSNLRSIVRGLEANFRSKCADLDGLRQSLLQKAFAGELT